MTIIPSLGISFMCLLMIGSYNKHFYPTSSSFIGATLTAKCETTRYNLRGSLGSFDYCFNSLNTLVHSSSHTLTFLKTWRNMRYFSIARERNWLSALTLPINLWTSCNVLGGDMFKIDNIFLGLPQFLSLMPNLHFNKFNLTMHPL